MASLRNLVQQQAEQSICSIASQLPQNLQSQVTQSVAAPTYVWVLKNQDAANQIKSILEKNNFSVSLDSKGTTLTATFQTPLLECPQQDNNFTILVNMQTMIETIKLWHWQTKSYPQHKSTDDLYSTFNGLIDEFIEVLMGKTQRFSIPNNNMSLNVPNFSSKEDFLKQMKFYIEFLNNIDSLLPPDQSNEAIKTIRDDMVKSLEQFSYLSTLS